MIPEKLDAFIRGKTKIYVDTISYSILNRKLQVSFLAFDKRKPDFSVKTEHMSEGT